MPALKSAKHEAFCRAIVEGMSGREAYARAGYTAKPAAADTNASRLLKNAQVSLRIAELKNAAAEAVKVSASKVFDELAKIGFANLMDYTVVRGDGELVTDFTELTRDQAAALQEVTVDTYMDGAGDDAREVKRVKVKLFDKRAALVDLGKHFGLFSGKRTDPEKTIGAGEPEPVLSELELARRIAFALEQGARAASEPPEKK